MPSIISRQEQRDKKAAIATLKRNGPTDCTDEKISRLIQKLNGSTDQ